MGDWDRREGMADGGRRRPPTQYMYVLGMGDASCYSINCAFTYILDDGSKERPEGFGSRQTDGGKEVGDPMSSLAGKDYQIQSGPVIPMRSGLTLPRMTVKRITLGWAFVPSRGRKVEGQDFGYLVYNVLLASRFIESDRQEWDCR